MTLPSHAALDAMGESRARWRDLALAAADMVFETDAAGRFVIAAPDTPFGWNAQALLGQDAGGLLIRPGGVAGVDPFLPQVVLSRHRVWIRRADGEAACVMASVTPLRDAAGQLVGARGALLDVTEHERQQARLRERLVRQRIGREIVRRMHDAILPDMIVKIGLDELMDITGASGAVIVARGPADADIQAPAVPGLVLHRTGEALPAPETEIVAHALARTHGRPTPWCGTEEAFGRPMLLCATSTHFSDPVLLMLWRQPGPRWFDGDAELAAEVLAALGRVLEYEAVRHELQRRSGTDALTGLLNRDSFRNEVNRRLDRLDAEGLSATLMLVGLDRFEEVSRLHGYEGGDEALRQAGHILRETVRPTDLVARLGGDVFGLWLDGADQFAAAERAEMLCQKGVAIRIGEAAEAEPGPGMRVSIGLASRASRSFVSVESLIEQAQAALAAVKLAGGGRWHVYNEELGG